MYIQCGEWFHLSADMYMYIDIYKYIDLHIYIYTCIYIYICIDVYIYICSYGYLAIYLDKLSMTSQGDNRVPGLERILAVGRETAARTHKHLQDKLRRPVETLQKFLVVDLFFWSLSQNGRPPGFI